MMKTGAAGRGFEPRNPGHDPGTLPTRLSLPRTAGALLEPVIHLSIDLEHKWEEPRRSRDRTGSGMKTDMAGQGVEPRTPYHVPYTLPTRLSLPRRVPTFLKLVFDPALIARYGRAGPGRQVTGQGQSRELI